MGFSFRQITELLIVLKPPGFYLFHCHVRPCHKTGIWILVPLLTHSLFFSCLCRAHTPRPGKTQPWAKWTASAGRAAAWTSGCPSSTSQSAEGSPPPPNSKACEVLSLNRSSVIPDGHTTLGKFLMEEKQDKRPQNKAFQEEKKIRPCHLDGIQKRMVSTGLVELNSRLWQSRLDEAHFMFGHETETDVCAF